MAESLALVCFPIGWHNSTDIVLANRKMIFTVEWSCAALEIRHLLPLFLQNLVQVWSDFGDFQSWIWIKALCVLERTVNILSRRGDLLENFSLYVLLDNLKSTIDFILPKQSVLPSIPWLSPYLVFIGSFQWFGWRSSESQLQFVCIHMNIP